MSTELLIVKTPLHQLEKLQCKLQTSIGQEVVDIGKVKFESLPKTTAWIRSHLLSETYFVFHDSITLLDDLDTLYLSDRDVLNKKHQADHGSFEN